MVAVDVVGVVVLLVVVVGEVEVVGVVVVVEVDVVVVVVEVVVDGVPIVTTLPEKVTFVITVAVTSSTVVTDESWFPLSSVKFSV